jgi:hypothetical protein
MCTGKEEKKRAQFPRPGSLQLSSLFGTVICLGDMLCKEDVVSKGIADHKLPKAPGLAGQGRAYGIGRQILLIEGITVGDADPTD